MPLDEYTILDGWPTASPDYRQWVEQASRAEYEEGHGFAVGARNRKVIAWKLQDARRDVEQLTVEACRDPQVKAEFQSGYAQFLASIDQPRHRQKAGLIAAELAPDRKLGRPLTSRRILGVANFLDSDMPTLPLLDDLDAWESAMQTAMRHARDARNLHSTGDAAVTETSPPGADPRRPQVRTSTRSPAPATGCGGQATWNPSRHQAGPSTVAQRRSPWLSGTTAAAGNEGDRQPGSLRNGRPGYLAQSQAEDFRSNCWVTFQRWCAERNLGYLPASKRTVLAFLKHRSSWRTADQLASARYTIERMHALAGHHRTFDYAPETEMPGQSNEPAPPYAPSRLNADAVAAIRATALGCRQLRLRTESVQAARNRGTLDIAICSFLQATGLSPEKAVKLQWRQLQKHPDGSAVVVLPSEQPLETAPCKSPSLSAEVVRELEAIRGCATLDDRIFGIVSNTMRCRVNAAAKAAGLSDQTP